MLLERVQCLLAATNAKRFNVVNVFGFHKVV